MPRSVFARGPSLLHCDERPDAGLDASGVEEITPRIVGSVASDAVVERRRWIAVDAAFAPMALRAAYAAAVGVDRRAVWEKVLEVLGRILDVQPM